MLAFVISLHRSKYLRLVNVSLHGSTTSVHGRDYHNTEVVVGDCAAELRPYIEPRKIIFNDFLGSATILLFCFCLDGIGLVGALVFTHHVG